MENENLSDIIVRESRANSGIAESELSGFNFSRDELAAYSQVVGEAMDQMKQAYSKLESAYAKIKEALDRSNSKS